MSHVTTSYSYDAPMDFINFTSLDDEEDTQNIDSWFEEKANLENKFPGKNGTGGLFQDKTPLRKANLQQDFTPLRPVDNTYNKEAEKENLVDESISSNTYSSIKIKETTSRNIPAQPQRRSLRLSAQKNLVQKEKHHVKMKAKRCATPVIINEIPPSKKMKVSNNKMKPEEEEEGSAHQDISEKNECSPEKAKGRRTGPCIPPIRQKVLKSTEEQELEKRMKMQQEVIEMRKKNEEFKKFALAGAGLPVKKSVTQVTKSVDFHFRTDERIKQHPKNQEEYKEVNFTSELRKHPPSPARVSKGCTIVMPFNLSKGKKRTFDETASTYVPLAQQVEAFHKRTPNRYHLRSKKDDSTLLPSKSVAKICRDPQTPVLQTKHRARPVTCKSTADQEAEELEKLQQYKFKAQELDPRILEGGPILPKKPPVKPPTQPIGFDLEIEKRIQERESKKKSEDEHFEFHSRPCPTKILEDVVGVPEKKVLPVTVPKSPAFTLKNRIRMPSKEDEEEEEPVVIRAQPVPYFGMPFKPQIPVGRTVEICPFSFDSRDKKRQLQKEKKIKELQKGEVPKFKALPLPHFDTVNLPEKKVKNTTQVEPFCLETDRRGALKAQTWKHQLEEELKQQKEAACFKARPNTVISQEPFVPKIEKKSLTVQETFQLATEKRARERQELEKRMAEVEAQKAQQLEEARQQEEEQQRQELARLRKELVHKANPIRKYQSVEVKSSDQPLTMPVSPKFSTRFHC
ncbi:targeting protein for Xklp2 isoform X2 [Sus scrofa]|uniref:Targeting protein for Xklp2 isoform X1 n=2 Tax=Sus scrofa TaxID=9823 RepID=A0A4X1SUR9_PIG|nr:targeting protein for Xklp2 isoform X2 [Sus scrofa]XP_020933760.1 targeting protein for Xklp2 isoform X2 [Sus scrofa]XP_020933761.1 targeting protein for Xklp2 isoform X2 [Sus scrofa]XP_020933762.1 targeting protein for Xklp2 isoform X2 [Sus scrofa]XP_020933763.1 targeting protein for Xklp2 isoform X2 [Sus scrofa]XP_020933764.1 targeting protein for Xklp2 isoform X2 [Sus scrofa]